ncbi:MAG: pyrroline-5-carboxylate reductase [Deltaproteobacteria bacterium]|nr:pyrroline-5-carboxylate reductase [Deltaproteobacteria bacterium]
MTIPNKKKIPLHNKKFCSFSRHAKISTAGIPEVFRGLEFSHNAENEQNKKLCKGIIGFIGAGNMGEAMIKAVINSDIAEPSSIYIYDPDPLRLNNFEQNNINIASGNKDLFDKSNIIIIAVKPASVQKVLNQITESNYFTNPKSEKKLIISIAAGITIKTIENTLYKNLSEQNAANLPIIRVMPNTPAIISAGISGISPNLHTTYEDIKIAKTIFTAMGEVLEFEEKYINPITALSGSGPAYLFYLAESMIEAGIAIGFDPSDAVKLTTATLKGAVKLIESSDLPVEKLREKVTSPKGTTEAAVNILDKNRVKENIIAAIIAANKRAKELSGI